MEKYYIGMDMGGTFIKVSLFDEALRKIDEVRMATGSQRGSVHVTGKMVAAAKLLLEKTGTKAEAVISMGIGVPGLLDVDQGISRFSPNFSDWEDVPVVEIMQDKLHIPTYIDNDARVNLYGEWQGGAGKHKKNIVLITLGTGLGAGAVIDGKVAYGATNSALELGHMNMFREGRPCRCGSSGCLGRYVSALGIIRTVHEKLEAGMESVLTEWVNGDLAQLTAAMVSQAYDTGDKVARETLHETGEILGYGLCNVISLFNPDIIIIGGGVSHAGERLLKETRRIVDERAIRISRAACEIVTAGLGDAAGMLGAAIYARMRSEHKAM